MRTSDNPRSSQENAFFGVNGIESLDGGQRGRFTEVKGLLYGASAADLQFAEILFRSYNDGFAYVLVDSYGGTWPYVKLETFDPQPRIKQDVYGSFYRAYTARLRHLI